MPAAGPRGFTYAFRMDPLVRFLPADQTIQVPAGTTLLEAARRAGLPLASSCSGEGACGRCGMRIVNRDPNLAPETDSERRVKARNRVEDELRLACRTGISSNITVTTSYW